MTDEIATLPSGPSTPIWIIAPGTPGGGQVDPGYGIDIGDQPLPPDVNPDDPKPTHPIVLPPELVDPGWGIELPVYPDQGLPEDQPHPAHPIYLPVYPDNALPEAPGEAGELSFYQRKTLGINWDASLLKSPAVGIYAEGSLVRTVVNDGSSSVTYPQDFTGDVTIRVADSLGNYCESSTTVV